MTIAKRLLFASAFAFLPLAAPAIAAPTARTYVVMGDMHNPNEATFTSKALLVRFAGRTSKVTGRVNLSPDDLRQASGSLAVDLASLDTGIALRNEHMRGFLETERHPLATFKFSGIEVAGNRLRADGVVTGMASGDLTIHGVTRRVSTPVELTNLPESDKQFRGGDWIAFSSQFRVKMSDYGIALPTMMLGVKVADEVVIDVNGAAKAN